MVDMYIIYGLISGILSSVLSSYIGYRICKREIVIKHNLNPFYWFWVHFLVSIFTVMLMAFSDFVYENFADVKNLPLGMERNYMRIYSKWRVACYCYANIFFNIQLLCSSNRI